MHDLLLITLIFLVVSYPKETAIFSITPIGKFIAICLILLYTSKSELYGLILCSIFILYYQSDYVENMEHLLYEKPIVPKIISQTNDLVNTIENQLSAMIYGDSSVFSYNTPFQDTYNDIIMNVKTTKTELMQLFQGIHETGIELIHGRHVTW